MADMHKSKINKLISSNEEKILKKSHHEEADYSSRNSTFSTGIQCDLINP